MSKYKDHLDQEGRDLQAKADALTNSMRTYTAQIDHEAHDARERAAHEVAEFQRAVHNEQQRFFALQQHAQQAQE